MTIESRPPETMILDIFAHGHCYGRPAGASAIDEIAKRYVERGNLWIANGTDIADHFRATQCR